MRAAIAALEDTGVRIPVLQPVPDIKPVPTVPATRATLAVESTPAVALPARAVARSVRPAAAVPSAPRASTAAPAPSVVAPSPTTRATTSPAEQDDALSNSATLRMLEAGAAAAGTPRQEPVCFAVQLMWSVQPIDLAQLPQLAIFNAYTLYGAEGNREGRRWYGLRLGFFTDALSAKQVAQYVRSEFSTVSVVPVTVRERERARLAMTRPSADQASVAERKTEAARLPKAKPESAEFKFIDDQPAAAKSSPAAGVPSAAQRLGRATRGAPGKRAKVRVPGQINGHARAKPMTLEQTLEILGAGELQVDTATETSINDSGVRHLRLEPLKSKPSKLSRLFERLAERIST